MMKVARPMVSKAHQRGLLYDRSCRRSDRRLRNRGAGNEGDAEGREGSQKLGGCVLRGEEQHREHRHCCGGVNVEIVELDGGTNERGENNSTAGVVFFTDAADTSCRVQRCS